MARGGWVVSVPGAVEVTIACPGSTLPNELAAAGYDLCADGWGEKILANAITERLIRTSSGALVPIGPGSTAPIAEIREHAGIARVRRYAFSMA